MNELNLGLGNFPFVFPLKFLKNLLEELKRTKKHRQGCVLLCACMCVCVCVWVSVRVGVCVRVRTRALLYIHNSEHLTTSMHIKRKVVKQNTGHWYNEMPRVLKRMRPIRTCWRVKMIAMYYSRDHSKVYIYKYLEHTETGNRSHPWDDSGGGGHSLFLLNTWVLLRGHCRRRYSENGLFWAKVKLETYMCIF